MKGPSKEVDGYRNTGIHSSQCQSDCDGSRGRGSTTEASHYPLPPQLQLSTLPLIPTEVALLVQPLQLLYQPQFLEALAGGAHCSLLCARERRDAGLAESLALGTKLTQIPSCFGFLNYSVTCCIPCAVLFSLVLLGTFAILIM